MKYRLLGKTGLSVSELGLGCSDIGASIFYKNTQASLELLQTAFDKGINFFDTASTYGYGTSETLIGKAFKGKRDKVIIATKAGYLPSSLAQYGRRLVPILGPLRSLLQPFKGKLKKTSKKRQNFAPDWIQTSIEESLKRLNTDYTDLLLLHSPPTEVIEAGEVFPTLDRLQKDGKVRFYGISIDSLSDGFLCFQYPNCSTLQIPFNLLEKDAAKTLLPSAAEKGIGIIARVPFARGLLTKDAMVKTDGNINNQVFREKALKARQKLLFLVQEGKRTWIEAAAQFILSHEQISTMIVGTRSPKHLEENIAALSASPLSRQEMKRIYSSFFDSQ